MVVPAVTAVVTLGMVGLGKVIRGFTYSLVSATKMARAPTTEMSVTQGNSW